MVCILLASLLCQGVPSADPGIRTDRKTVVIDPGHGGTSPGSITPSGAREKDIMLVLSRMVAETLEPDFTVVLTRTDDMSLTLDERSAMANRHKANLFISLHAKPGTARNAGVSIFFHQPSQDRNTMAPGTWDAAQIPCITRSMDAAGILCRALSPQTRSEDCAMGVPVAVLAGATMPALLIEPFSLAEFADSGENAHERLKACARDLATGIRAVLTPPEN